MKKRFLNKKILFVGYGLTDRRFEAVDINTNRIARLLMKSGAHVYFSSLSSKISFLKHIMNREAYLKKTSELIEREKITHVHDVFVLPAASLLFTKPLILKYPNVSFIKEIQNDSGYSSLMRKEKIIRMFFNTKSQLRQVMRRFDRIVSRSRYLSDKYNISYLPSGLLIRPLARKLNTRKVFSVCYLGHPLKKKGLDVLVRLLRIIPKSVSKKMVFDFALSSLGNRSYYRDRIKNAAIKSNIRITIRGIVKPDLFFRKNDILLLPLEDQFSAASVPNTLLEAMEAGCAAITTKTEFSKYIIKDGTNGFLMNKPSAQNLLKILIRATKKEIDITKVAKNARADVIKQYSQGKVLGLLANIYE